ncbi:MULTISPECIES: flagellin [Clostridium]|uniref:Flagellin n=1 Tax=Clostridium ljungdahlii (strain ATCC 55383 / DSM 13528 / PETC) TaxID=748727 RepID=D8GQA8_CLOLD|nr:MULTISPECIES: flagellin [Clostridium]ADK14031.1 flagellin protein [Clostridium ljungdahlii DSM 13528]ALU37403.1 Flagellin domain protein [Clostridium autoethanogenum DSM 10061]OAA87522.1 Flagellin [Clostridium ljungdahlii DSM 13528]OVY50029.1 Flagellin [Clostridium autoethanogenum]
MIINHNLQANNAIRNMNINSNNASKSMQKLSSGLRINSAADDAAGLAISEKMRGQINGLDQAASNSQDAISMVQTAEGALNETTSILQRMRQLANQSANGTNVTVDRQSIQTEMNQLTSEINRIGNTTEFNTQSLLKGDGSVKVAGSGLTTGVGNFTGGVDPSKTAATQTNTITATATAADTYTVTLNGQALTVTFAASNAGGQAAQAVYNVTGTAATVNLESTATVNGAATGIRTALQDMIDNNSALKGNYTVTGNGANVTITAVSGGTFDGAAGIIGASAKSGTTLAGTAAGNTGTTSTGTAAAATITIGGTYSAYIGTGMTIDNQQVEFYDGTKGAYTGSAIGVDLAGLSTADDISKAIIAQAGPKLSGVTLATGGGAGKVTISAADPGVAGNQIKVQDGSIQQNFKTTMQVGANMGQTFEISIADMRSNALGIAGTAGASVAGVAGAKFTSTNVVTDGTSATLREASLDVSTTDTATAALKVLDNATAAVSAQRSQLGAYQNRLEHTIANLGTSSENLTSAESRIRDVDMAKEMSAFSKNNILSQAAQAMLAQANQQPQQVLQLLR